MSLKRNTLTLIQNRQYDELAQLVEKDRRAVKYMYTVLYEPNSMSKWKGVDAFGYLARAFAPSAPEFVRDIVRRFLWMMNEEGGNSNWSAPEAIGEIIFNSHETTGYLAPMMITAALEERIFQKGMLWAIGRFGGLIPEKVKLFEGDLISFLENDNAQLRGLAARAMGISGISKALPKLKPLIDDNEVVEYYFNGKIIKSTVGILAKEAIFKLN